MEEKRYFNGRAIDFGSLIVKIDGEDWNVVGVTFDETRARTKGYSNDSRRAPVARTAGRYTPGDLKVSMRQQTAERFRVYMANKAGSDSFGDGEAEISAIISEPGQPVLNNVFRQCVIAGESDPIEDGEDELKVEFTLDHMGRTINGRHLWAGEE